MNKKILIEAAGSPVVNWLVKAIKDNGDIPVASDITGESAGKFLAGEFVKVPPHNDPDLWRFLEHILVAAKIDIVIPSLDETLPLWAAQKDYLACKYGIKVIISEKETIDIFLDKYQTYLFFTENQIPTPQVSLRQEYPLIKPRTGRGGKGVRVIEEEKISMEGLISQEFLSGQEYTVDCLIDHKGRPVYIVPRKRLKVTEGKSVHGIVTRHEEIIDLVEQVCKAIRFFGPINIQCFATEKGIMFTEINPRIGGGMALGLAATENWITLIEKYLLPGKEIEEKKEIKYGLRMYRYYEEIFV